MHWEFPATPAAVPAARHQATAALRGQVDAAAAQDVELVLAELVTNAVTAGASVVEIDVQCTRRVVRLWVEDDGSPVMRTPSGVDTAGRALRVVSEISARWGSGHGTTGRTMVWAVLPTADAAAASVD